MNFKEYVDEYFRFERASNPTSKRTKLEDVDDGQFKRFFDKMKGREQYTPNYKEELTNAVTKTDIKNKQAIDGLFEKVDDKLKEDPSWKDFWKDRNSKKDRDLQQKVLFGHRFAMLQGVFVQSKESKLNEELIKEKSKLQDQRSSEKSKFFSDNKKIALLNEMIKSVDERIMLNNNEIKKLKEKSTVLQNANSDYLKRQLTSEKQSVPEKGFIAPKRLRSEAVFEKYTKKEEIVESEAPKNEEFDLSELDTLMKGRSQGRSRDVSDMPQAQKTSHAKPNKPILTEMEGELKKGLSLFEKSKPPKLKTIEESSEPEKPKSPRTPR